MTSRSLPGFSSPSASTEAPLEMLSACHGRVEHQCATLGRLREHVARHGANDAARQAATAVMRYFDTAAVHHHADEEADLFPALHAATTDAAVRALTGTLRADHRVLESRWAALRAALTALVAGDTAGWAAADVAGFVAAYRNHITREDQELLPLAARLLDEPALARVGAAMRERRGIAPVT